MATSWKKVLAHFASVDRILASAAANGKPILMKTADDLFLDLCESIISQQLSTKVADVITARFYALFKPKDPTPSLILGLSPEKIRAIGTSNMKVSFIRDLAERVLDGRLKIDELPAQTNDEVKRRLIEVKGIGPWTAEMVLMFGMGREDIFSTGDLGLKRAIQKLYKLKHEPSEKKLLQLSKKWAPYRTYACRVLWNSLDQ
jgi:DNA-3-methyladenine glycosylase II